MAAENQTDSAIEQCAPPPVIPYLTIRGAANAIDWYKKALGAVEQMRLPADDGKRLMHAAISINGGSVFMSDEFVEYDGGSAPKDGQIPPVAIALNFNSPAEVDSTFKRAVEAGATAVTEPRDEFWGARFAVFGDPFGHRWLLNAALEKK
jgi:PhnB protein